MSKVDNQVHVIGIQMDLGASKRGVNMGPLAIRYAGLLEKIQRMGFSSLDKGDIVPKEAFTENLQRKNFTPIFEANKELYEKVKDSFQAGALPIILGGDHSIAAGSVAATLNCFSTVGVIWVDAHGDFNDDISSPSGNMHGMPLSSLCGKGPDEMIAFADKKVFLDPNKVVLIGARDIDAEERLRLIQAGVHVFSIHDVDQQGMAAVMRQAIEITTTGTDGVHVSFDVDAITPQEAPGVGTPVHSGLTVRESFLAAEMIAETGKLLALDMVEVNPILDKRNRTGSLACELILAFLGKSVF